METACNVWKTNGQVGSCRHQLWIMYTRGFISLILQKQLQGNIADEDLWESSKYLVDGVFAALQEMFSNARKIQVCASHLLSQYYCQGTADTVLKWDTFAIGKVDRRGAYGSACIEVTCP